LPSSKTSPGLSHHFTSHPCLRSRWLSSAPSAWQGDCQSWSSASTQISAANWRSQVRHASAPSLKAVEALSSASESTGKSMKHCGEVKNASFHLMFQLMFHHVLTGLCTTDTSIYSF
jgi:hypothetical protein